MSRADAIFCLAVLILCVAFVPVWFFFVFSESVMPLSAMFFDFAVRSMGWLPAGSYKTGVLLYCLFYTGAFAALALIFTVVTRRCSRRAMFASRIALCCVILLGSALPVITHSGLSGSGGSYSFWTAIPRYFEKYFK